MRERLIGPGPPCSYCREVYGRHKRGCKRAQEIEDRRAQENRELGQRILDAIERRDAAALGEFFRSLTP